MNQHVDRRAILASSVAAAAALAAVATPRQADASETVGAAHQGGAHPDAELFQLEAEMEAASARLKKIERAQRRLGKKAEKASGPRPLHPMDWKAPPMPDDLWEMHQAALNQASFADIRDGKKWRPAPLAAWQESVDQERAMIQAAWDGHSAKRAEGYRLVNYDAKQAEFSTACDEEWQLGMRILAIPAHTLEGIMVKVRASDRLHLEEFAGHDAYVSIAADVRRLVACTRDTGSAAILGVAATAYGTLAEVNSAPVHPDRDLLDLGKEFEARWANERAVYAAEKGQDSNASDERCNIAARRTKEVVELMSAMSARTVEGYRLLARAYIWCRGENPDEMMVLEMATHITTDRKIRAQLINSLLGHTFAGAAA